jgi:hypothetical protein
MGSNRYTDDLLASGDRSASELIKEVVQPAISLANNATVPCIFQANSPTLRQLSNFAPLPNLLVTSKASYHAPYDYCTVAFVKQAGCSNTKHLELPKDGICGNAHMMFLENNSDEIWERVDNWIKAAS